MKKTLVKKVLMSVLAGSLLMTSSAAFAEGKFTKPVGSFYCNGIGISLVGTDQTKQAVAVLSNDIAVGFQAKADGNGAKYNAIAIGANSIATGGVAIGLEANSENGIALGVQADADSEGIAVGNGAESDGGIALGKGTKATDEGSGVALGNNAASAGGIAIGGNFGVYTPAAQASGHTTVAIGTSATTVDKTGGTAVAATYATAVGYGATADKNDSTAIGSSAKAVAKDATAVGYKAQATEESATAFGSGAEATGRYSVAIGAWSKANEDNVVSFGNEYRKRRLTNVAAGKNNYDAVNVGQLKNTLIGSEGTDGKLIADELANAYGTDTILQGKTSVTAADLALADAIRNISTTGSVDGVHKDQLEAETKAREEADKQINTRVDGVEQNVAGVKQDLNKLGNRLDKVGAGAAALAALNPLEYDPDDKLTFSAGVGNYSGETAAAIGAFYRPNEKFMISMAGSMGNGENMVNMGLSIGLDGAKGMPRLSKREMAQKIDELSAQNEALTAKNAAIEAEVAELKAMVAQLAAKK